MMKQYEEIKAKHPGSLLLYRMGDFYELFNEDAITASKILGLTLTARNHGGDGGTPLAGFPHHAIERYMPKLIGAGLKVAICEQVEDPATAKGVVKREVVEVVTRGTALNENYLESKTNNYLAAVYPGEDLLGLAYLDLSTGEFTALEGGPAEAANELGRINVQEVVVPEFVELPGFLAEMGDREKLLITPVPKGFFHESEGAALLQRQFKVHSLEAFGAGHLTVGIRAAAAALAYVRENKKTELGHLVKLRVQRFDSHMALDSATIRNLELVRPLHADDETGTLFHLLDRTVTAMGGRKLKYWLTHPLLNRGEILERQSAVAELTENPVLLDILRKHLREINDIERIMAKTGSGRAHARDLVGLGSSLLAAADVGDALHETRSPLFTVARDSLCALRSKGQELLARLTERPPLTVREGNMIRARVYPELDELVNGIRDGREWMNSLQVREREATGITTLKVGFNKVFGYYIEVTKAQESKVPTHYLRKQSLVNGERYITAEMKEWESRILNAEGEINALEYRIFCSIRDEVNTDMALYLETAGLLGAIDSLACLAAAARELNFTAPEITEEPLLHIDEGRHPVVEAITEEGQYIPNDLRLNLRDRQILLITGPNMAGKSTYLRQVGLITLLAQVGSFVPAAFARIGLVDRIFTRVGAADRLSKGQSTFMVEMLETANILNYATPRSLVLLDEIGRGTSTYDGLSLAWAIAETLHENPAIAARTLFATHYHELTELAGRFPRIRNVQVTVKETESEVIFLRKVVEGGCDSSYGIQVAAMAGVPQSVIDRAWEILGGLEKDQKEIPIAPTRSGETVQEAISPLSKTRNDNEKVKSPGSPSTRLQVDLFGNGVTSPEDIANRKICEELRGLNLNGLTPLDVVQRIAQIQNRLSREQTSS